jgi:hypothetical protein
MPPPLGAARRSGLRRRRGAGLGRRTGPRYPHPLSSHSDRARRHHVRPAQRRQQGLGPVRTLPRSRLHRGAAASANARSAASAPGSARPQSGVRVAALAVVNAAGSVTVGDGPWFWAAPFEIDGEYGKSGLPPSFTPDMLTMRLKGGAAATGVENITLAVIVTDAVLTKHQANGPAQMSLPVSRPARRVFAAMFVFRWRFSSDWQHTTESHQITKGETRMLVVMINNIIARAPERAPGRWGGTCG